MEHPGEGSPHRRDPRHLRRAGRPARSLARTAARVPADDRWAVGLGLVVGLAVCAPFFGGWLFLLDQVPGPHPAIVPPDFWGTGSGITSGLPFAILANALTAALGEVGSLLPVLCVFPIGMVTMGRLVGGTRLRRIAAGLLYVVNPFVFDRVFAGDTAFLLGYALLPAAVTSAYRLVTGEGSPWATALWVAGLVALSPHYGWIALVPVLTLVASALTVRGARLRVLLGAAASAVAAFAISLYVVVPPLLTGSRPAGVASQLSAYRTSGDARVGLYVNVLGLYGFWRAGPREPKDLFSGWPAVLAAILIVVGLGVYAAVRDRPARRLCASLLAAGLIGYFLALGTQGPTGAVYAAAVRHVPGFVVMREPEKFSALLALALAFGFGWGAEQLKSLFDRHGWIALGAAVLIPFAYTPNLVGGLGGQLATSRYPASWLRAAAVLRQGGGTVAVFPWDQYVVDPMAQRRVTAEPGRELFGNTLTGTNPGPGYGFGTETRLSAAVTFLIDNGYSTTHAGAFLGQYGVRWVVLEKVPGFQSYGWLDQQRDLKPVVDDSSIELFRVDEPTLVPRVDPRRVALQSPLGLIEHAAALADQVPAVDAEGPGTQPGLVPASEITTGPRAAVRRSPVAWTVPPGHRGFLVTPIPYARGWELGGHAGIALPTGNLAVYSDGKGGVLAFAPWAGIRDSYWASLAALVLTTAAALGLRLRPTRRPRPSRPEHRAGRHRATRPVPEAAPPPAATSGDEIASRELERLEAH